MPVRLALRLRLIVRESYSTLISLLLRPRHRFTLSDVPPFIQHRAVPQTLRILSRYSTGSYPRYARKLLRNVVLGRKFAAAVIEPPYRAQLSTANPGLLRYTFESDFPWMSGAVAATRGIRM